MTEQLIRMGSAWITRQREQFRHRGKPLSPDALECLMPYFHPETLELVLIVRVPRIENPAFYGTLLTSRFPRLLDFRKASGITFIDTILLSEKHTDVKPDLPLLFHEIVHVVQYRLLGVSEFTRRYVSGWARNGYRYEAIPLEEQASSLTTRFAEGNEKFSAELEVGRTMPS